MHTAFRLAQAAELRSNIYCSVNAVPCRELFALVRFFLILSQRYTQQVSFLHSSSQQQCQKCMQDCRYMPQCSFMQSIGSGNAKPNAAHVVRRLVCYAIVQLSSESLATNKPMWWEHSYGPCAQCCPLCAADLHYLTLKRQRMLREGVSFIIILQMRCGFIQCDDLSLNHAHFTSTCSVSATVVFVISTTNSKVQG
jgi:hypothetical protein